MTKGMFMAVRFYLQGVWGSPMLKSILIVFATIANLLLAALVGAVFYSDFGSGPFGLLGGGFYFVLTFLALQLQLLVIVASSEN